MLNLSEINLDTVQDVLRFAGIGVIALLLLAFMVMCSMFFVTRTINWLRRRKKERTQLKKDLKDLNDDKVFQFVEEARREFKGDSSNN